MAVTLEQGDRVRRELAALEVDAVGQPLVVDAPGVHRFLGVHSVIHDIQDGLHHGVDDRPTAGRAGDHEEFPVLRHDGGRHARQHPLVAFGEVRVGADEAAFVGEAGGGVEVTHLVVQQEAAAGDHDAGAVAELEGIGERDRVPFPVHHREVGRLFAFGRPFETLRRGDGRFLLGDRGPQLGRIPLGSEPLDGDRRVEVGVAEMERAVGEGAAHRFGHDMEVLRGTETGVGEFVALQDVQHFDQRDAAGTRGRHRDDLVAAVLAADGLAHLRFVRREVFVGDEAVVGFHLRDQQVGRAAGVEAGGAVLQDPLQGVGEVRLPQDLAGLVGHAVLRELRHRGRILLHPVEHARQRSGEAVRNREALPGEFHRRAHQPLPGKAAALFPGEMQPGDGARHSHRAVAQVVEFEGVLAVLQPHLRGRRGRRHLAEVVGDRIAGGRAVHQEAAAADVPGGRMGHRQREGGGHRGVHRVPPFPEDRGADLGGRMVLRDDHAVAGADGDAAGFRGLRGERRRRQPEGQPQEDRRDGAAESGERRPRRATRGDRGNRVVGDGPPTVPTAVRGRGRKYRNGKTHEALPLAAARENGEKDRENRRKHRIVAAGRPPSPYPGGFPAPARRPPEADGGPAPGGSRSGC